MWGFCLGLPVAQPNRRRGACPARGAATTRWPVRRVPRAACPAPRASPGASWVGGGVAGVAGHGRFWCCLKGKGAGSPLPFPDSCAWRVSGPHPLAGLTSTHCRVGVGWLCLRRVLQSHHFLKIRFAQRGFAVNAFGTLGGLS